MKNCLIVLFLFLSITKVVAQVKEHQIDKQLRKCLDSTQSTTASMLDCTGVAYDAWDKELNKYYKNLMATLGAEGKAKLKTAQVNWLTFRDNEFKLIDALYNNEGSMWGPIKLKRQMEIVRARALELKEYYEMINLH